MKFETLCASGTEMSDGIGRPLAPPIVPATTFAFADQAAIEEHFETGEGYVYSRYGNPTVRLAERFLAKLENAGGAALFSSGMAAISTTLTTLVGAGGVIAAQREIYGGAAHLLRHVFPHFGIEIRWLGKEELQRLRPDALAGCGLLYLESPINPTLGIVDLERQAEVAHAAGVKVVVDGTFATPALQRPLDLGCDLVIHSCTKYLGGHGDVTAGAVAGQDAPIEEIRHRRRSLGGVLDPFQAFLLHRGMRTLAVRMAAHERGARQVAEALNRHPRVARVLWPGLPDHPDHQLARRQMSGFGGMVTFEVTGGVDAAIRAHDRLELFSKAGSLGGVESLVSIPGRMSHRYLTEEERVAVGVTPGMVRLSVGLESPDDLVADLEQALR